MFGDTRAEVALRDVAEADIKVFFEHQRDPEATAMAAFAAREWEPFLAHWTRIRADTTVDTQTITVDGITAGNVVSWEDSGRRLIGYWIGRDYWGRGIATEALRRFLQRLLTRPLYAHVAAHNSGSIRVPEKCGFRVAPSHSGVASADDVEELVLILEG